MSHSAIEIYTTPTCPDCLALKRWLDAQGLIYVERDLTRPHVADEARRRTGLRVAPITLVDGKAIWGTAAEQIPRLRKRLALGHAA